MFFFPFYRVVLCCGYNPVFKLIEISFFRFNSHRCFHFLYYFKSELWLLLLLKKRGHKQLQIDVNIEFRSFRKKFLFFLKESPVLSSTPTSLPLDTTLYKPAEDQVKLQATLCHFILHFKNWSLKQVLHSLVSFSC